LARRAVLIGAAAVAVFALLFGPSTYVVVTGRPLVLDCGHATPEHCETAMRQAARAVENLQGSGGPVTYFTFQPYTSESSSCGQFHIELGTFTFGALGQGAQPFC
jgi:hypothetical protein